MAVNDHLLPPTSEALEDAMTSPDTAKAGLAGRAGALAAGTGIANVLAYVLTVVGARALGPDEFGAFTALLAMVIVGNVAALAIQATTARAVVRDGTTPVAIRSGLIVSAIVTVALAAASPLIAALMNLTSSSGAVAAAVAVGALAITAPALGLVQGQERFQALAVLLAAQAALRVAGGIVGIVVVGTSTAALVGIAVGFAVAAALCWAVARPPLAGGTPDPASGLRATALNGTMLLGFILLTNVDVVLARHVLSEHDSGLYAAGAIIAKVGFWLPQFVPLLAFPALSDPARRRGAVRLGVTAAVACGTVLVGMCWVLAEPVVEVVAGPEYASLTPWVPAFATLGAMYALAYLLVYAHLAHGDRWTIALVWAVLVGYVAWVEVAADRIGGVVVPGIVAATAVVVWGLVRERVVRARA